MDFFHDRTFSEHVEALMLEYYVPGVSIAVAHGTEPAIARAFGYASLTNNQPCTADTLFDIASSAKSLTAAAVALLVEDNENYAHLQYETSMSSLLPDDFVMSSAQHTKDVTVEDVLSHRTGMAGHDDSYMGLRAAEPDTPQSITRNLRNLPVAAPCRSRYLYCNMMYTVATYLVETESKQPFSEFLEQRFFEPLSMDSSSLQPARSIERGFGSRLAQGHIWDRESETYQTLECRDCPEGQGAGSVISSANDFIKWVQALIHRKFPITETVYRGLVRMRSIVNPSGRRLKPHSSPAIYAAGMEVYYYRGHEVIGHDGSTTGFASRFVLLPELQLGIVVMGNSSGAGPVCRSIIRALMDEAMNIPASERNLHKKRKEKKSTKALPSKQDLPTRTVAGRRIDEMGPGGGTATTTHRQVPNLTKKVKTKEFRPASGALQEIALEAYTGVYSNAGYRAVTVATKGEKLFIDASDRSMGFTLTFEHRKDQTKYIAYLSDALEGGSEPVDAEIIFLHGRAVRLGLDLEPAVRGLVWFDFLTSPASVQSGDGTSSLSGVEGLGWCDLRMAQDSDDSRICAVHIRERGE
ncbi:hypothetical protein LLEC1_00586 [Akanthomyces lecanii]|uniref:Beta-lactamase-related domain-containing protein n=1 Tax=Cordyceps confragosa TaxID=2714763 RepID=A0A179IBX5_CORDF|nr:hypothetical protein LLEC1_00586 [Akanthomyces lecanii]